MLTSVEEFLIFGFIPLLIGIFAVPPTETAPEPVISGRLVIPPSTRFGTTRSPSSNSSSCGAAKRCSRRWHPRSTGWRGGTEHGFAIRFEPSQIRPAGSYAVRARIIADATVWFETPYPQPVAPLSGEPAMLVLVPTAQRLNIRASGAATIR